MPCCCTRILNLCNVAVCGTLEIKQAATAPESGASNTYLLVLDFLETTITLSNEQIEGLNIVFDVSNLNENFQYRGQIFDSAGNQVSILYDEIEYDCIKFKTIMAINAPASAPPVLKIANTVVVEDVIGEDYVITGATDAVSGLADGSNTITSNAFIGVRVIVVRGNIPIPGIDPGDSSNYFTKALASNYITLNNILVDGEFIRIQTIPN